MGGILIQPRATSPTTVLTAYNGTGPAPALTFTGAYATTVLLQVTTGGLGDGTAKFKWKTITGSAWTTGVSSAVGVLLGTTGLTLDWDPGQTYIVNDAWSIVCTPGVAGNVVAQSTFAQMAGEIQRWNPEVDNLLARRWLNNVYRRIVDSRNWYGMLLRGQLTVPAIYTTGTVAVTVGYNTVTGTGTAWDASFIGRQFRSGYTQSPIATITNVADATHLTLEAVWGGTSYTSTGYQIFQSIVNFGAKVKLLTQMINLRQNRPMEVNVPQAYLDARDPWRSRIGWAEVAACYPASVDGITQWELWPIPVSQQTFPYRAYVQPPDLSANSDVPYPFIRSDILVYGAIPFALLHGGLKSKYYDPVTAKMFMGMFAAEMMKLELKDNDYFQKDGQWDWNRGATAGAGMYAQMTDVSGGD